MRIGFKTQQTQKVKIEDRLQTEINYFSQIKANLGEGDSQLVFDRVLYVIFILILSTKTRQKKPSKFNYYKLILRLTILMYLIIFFPVLFYHMYLLNCRW